MNLECPNCTAVYKVSSAAIGPDGRNIKCAKCSETWFVPPERADEEDYAFQSPEPEYEAPDNEVVEPIDHGEMISGSDDFVMEEPEDSLDVNIRDDEPEEEIVGTYREEEKIPDAVKPFADDVPAYVAEPKVRASFQARLSGYLLAVLIFAALIGAGFAYKQKITSLWPPAAAIYDLAGLSVMFKGEELVMETVSAIVTKDNSNRDVLVLKGRIINLSAKAVEVPVLRAILRSTDGEDGESWIIDPPVDQIAAGESFTFTSDYTGVPNGVGSVNLTFVPAVAGQERAKLSE